MPNLASGNRVTKQRNRKPTDSKRSRHRAVEKRIRKQKRGDAARIFPLLLQLVDGGAVEGVEGEPRHFPVEGSVREGSRIFPRIPRVDGRSHEQEADREDAGGDERNDRRAGGGAGRGEGGFPVQLPSDSSLRGGKDESG